MPELVRQNTLCPHQDFVYFSLPKDDEAQELKEHTKNAESAVSEIIKLDSFKAVFEDLTTKYERYFKVLYTSEKELISLFVLFDHAGFVVEKKLLKVLAGQESLPEYSLMHADTAIEFLLNSELTLGKAKKEIREILQKYKLVERGKVSVYLNSKIKKSLSASMAKLESISRIVKIENQSLKEDLRMLILTDFIRQESVKNINTDKPFKSISIVSIFEVLRRENPSLKLGAISGALVILPTETKAVLATEVGLSSKDFSAKEIAGTNYSFFNFKGGNKNKVKFVSILFEKGSINVLVGTKSLLGEGWDSPCINSLVLASFIGSFVLSNQMRGRAIRIYNAEPDKCSNIWHLVTLNSTGQIIEDNQSKQTVSTTSYDFDTLSRRFECFVGPNYKTGEIENGVQRVIKLKPPLDEDKMKEINAKTEELSQDRENTRKQWLGGTKNNTELCVETEIPVSKRLPSFNLGIILLALMLSAEIFLWVNVFTKTTGLWKLLLCVVLFYVSIYVMSYFIKLLFKVIHHLTPQNSIKTLSMCVMKTLQDMNEISKDCKLHVSINKENKCVGVSISKASLHEQNIFHDCLVELFSSNDNPRYVLVYTGFAGVRDYVRSLICPRLFGENKKSINIFLGNLEKYSTKFEAVYIKTEESMQTIINCRKESYIFRSGDKISKKQKILQ